MNTFLKKLIPHNIAAIIGIAQIVVPLLKEVVIGVIRIVDVLTPGTGLEPMIVKTASLFDKATAGINKFKNMFLEV